MDVVTDSGHRVSYSNVTPDVAGFILDEVLVRKNYKLDGLLGQFKNGKAPLPGHPDDRGSPLLQEAGEVRPAQLRRHRPRVHRRLPRPRRVQGPGEGPRHDP